MVLIGGFVAFSRSQYCAIEVKRPCAAKSLSGASDGCAAVAQPETSKSKPTIAAAPAHAAKFGVGLSRNKPKAMATTAAVPAKIARHTPRKGRYSRGCLIVWLKMPKSENRNGSLSARYLALLIWMTKNCPASTSKRAKIGRRTKAKVADQAINSIPLCISTEKSGRCMPGQRGRASWSSANEKKKPASKTAAGNVVPMMERLMTFS